MPERIWIGSDWPEITRTEKCRRREDRTAKRVGRRREMIVEMKRPNRGEAKWLERIREDIERMRDAPDQRDRKTLKRISRRGEMIVSAERRRREDRMTERVIARNNHYPGLEGSILKASALKCGIAGHQPLTAIFGDHDETGSARTAIVVRAVRETCRASATAAII